MILALALTARCLVLLWLPPALPSAAVVEIELTPEPDYQATPRQVPQEVGSCRTE
jgi:hypothetical protein